MAVGMGGACGSTSNGDTADDVTDDNVDDAVIDAGAPDAPSPDATPLPDAVPECGNGVVEFGEECDNDSALCSACAVTAAQLGFTGDLQTLTVPPGVTELRFTLTGASGGDSISCVVSPEEYQADGGFGAVVAATIAVTPGDVLNLRVGGAGGLVTIGDYANVGAGGYNGGGSCGHYGGCGGGATDVRIGGDDLASRVLIAGGGGGGNTGCPDFGSGGDAAADGGDGIADGPFPAGGGGTQAAGGTAGQDCTAGELGQGGSYIVDPYHRAGGGGGYYGGGAAYAAGAGAGSSFTPGDATDVEITTAAARGDGMLTISIP